VVNPLLIRIPYPQIKDADETMTEVYSDDDEDFEQSSADSQLELIGEINQPKGLSFTDIPKQWYRIERILNHKTQRTKLLFKCKIEGCSSVFKKSCNLRDHFRKHTGDRPFKCSFCKKTFTQSGNLGRHLKNVHHASRKSRKIKEDLTDNESTGNMEDFSQIEAVNE
jgi:hypothetical protein